MGTTAATAGNGDFGTSPFFGQFLGKQQLAYTGYGVPGVKAQWRIGLNRRIDEPE
jgi:hypothetical protein